MPGYPGQNPREICTFQDSDNIVSQAVVLEQREEASGKRFDKRIVFVDGSILNHPEFLVTEHGTVHKRNSLLTGAVDVFVE